MEFFKKGAKRQVSLTKVFIFIFIILVLVWLFFFSGVFKKTCETDICFNDAAQTCKKANFRTIKESNLFSYDIKGPRGDVCVIDIELEKMGVGTSIELIEKFEGKSMECRVPKSQLKDTTIEDLDNVINFCTGPLKESIYELMIKRLYGVIIGNMDEVLEEIKKTI